MNGRNLFLQDGTQFILLEGSRAANFQIRAFRFFLLLALLNFMFAGTFFRPFHIHGGLSPKIRCGDKRGQAEQKIRAPHLNGIE